MVKRKSGGDFMKTNIQEEELRKLYWEKNLSTLQIAKILGFRSKSSVLNHMMKFGIPRRPSDKKNYFRKPFSGNLDEKAYLLGLRTGDLFAKKHFNLILISMTSPKAAQMKMFNEAFGGYAHITEREAKGGFTETTRRADSLLHPSFEFLAEKNSSIPFWILQNNQLFYFFLAGYCDAEASWIVTEHKRYKGRWKDLVFSLGTCDKNILEQINQKLRDLGFNSHLYLVRRKGIYGTRVCNFDLYRVMMSNHDDIVRLAKILLSFSKHDDKKKAMMKVIDYRNDAIKKLLLKRQNSGTVKIQCIYCNHKKVWRNGFSKYKNKKYRRYKCPQCKKEFQKSD